MKIQKALHEGVFINEIKNRFLCNVKINGQVHECHIPSSSRLENYLRLRNKKVLLTENEGKNTRTKYSVFAVKHYNSYILLNLSMANKLLAEQIKENIIKNNSPEKVYTEKTIEDYKTDLFIEGSNQQLIIEVKGIISTKTNQIFPTVYSERAVAQLYKLQELLKSGWNITYYFISLSSTVKAITINSQFKDYWDLFQQCITLGMKIKGSYIHLDGEEIRLCSDIPVVLKNDNNE